MVRLCSLLLLLSCVASAQDGGGGWWYTGSYRIGGYSVGYYPMSNNSTDSVGVYNGLDTNITYTSSATGRFGIAAVFNGTTAKIATSAIQADNPTSATISLWLKSTTTPTNFDRSIIAKMANVSAGSIGWSVSIAKTDGRIYVYNQGATGATYVSTIMVPGQVNIWNSGWHNLIVTWAAYSDSIYIYIDGQKTSTATGRSGTLVSTSNSIATTIGCDAAVASNKYFPGTIDEIIIESRAWSDREVAEYYRRNAAR